MLLNFALAIATVYMLITPGICVVSAAVDLVRERSARRVINVCVMLASWVVLGLTAFAAPSTSQGWFDVSGRLAVGVLFLLLTTRQARDAVITFPLGGKQSPRD